MKENIKKALRHFPFLYPIAKKIHGFIANNVFVRAFLFVQFIGDYRRFRKMSTSRFSLKWSKRYPILNQKHHTFGYDRHYLFHIAWASRKLAQIKPKIHFDISSQIYFVTSISAFIPVKYYEFKAADISLDGLSFESADVTNLPFKDRSIHSLSCMHVVEHVGLGRYGDPLDYNGDLRAISELQRVLAGGGNLLFVVPISGKQRIEFNAHRVFSYQQIIDGFKELRLQEFALIPDNHNTGDLLINASRKIADLQQCGCGCFWFVRDK